ncbi:Hpt domain-containing protein [Planomonospora sp. ID82291]|uniref:Hpt domain-containing protein n=1 Tax=Planomonospora sp. ID82291 TaxID=2738136 RepID=UPI0018C3E69E|nr:Hpt domain-containing protein [Planomonospora sp. ID82291]MBG0817964.1 Hpt domain-containing protein [Planomonospora sp. ID82291]
MNPPAPVPGTDRSAPDAALPGRAAVTAEAGLDVRVRIADLMEDDSEEEIEFVERIVVSFLKRAPAALDRLAGAIAAADAEEAARQAHALKGSAANLGVSAVAGLCAEAEHLAEAARLGELGGHPARLEQALAEAGAHLTGALARLRAGRPLLP